MKFTKFQNYTFIIKKLGRNEYLFDIFNFTPIVTLSPFKHCRVTLKILPERQFRLNETSNHFIQGEGGGRGRGRPPAVGMNQHTA